MLTIFPYSSVFCSDECLFTPIKMHFFADSQDQTIFFSYFCQYI